MRFLLPAAAALLLISPALPIAQAQTEPDNPTPLVPKTESQSLVQQLLREGKVMRASDAKRGMKGYALSVFQGTKIERFNVEVLGTLERVQGGGDLVMIRVLDGPVVKRQSGIIQGMSGSPVYINGKLLGAIAIGFGFPKEPIGGVTPITEMIEGALPDNSPRPAPVKVAAQTAATSKTRLAQAIDEQLKASEKQTFAAPPAQKIEGAYVPKEPLRIGARNVTRVAVSSDARVPDWSGPDAFATMAMRPCTRLVLLSGVAPSSLPRWQRLFAPYGLTPMIGGGAMSKSAQMQVFGTPSQKTGVKANLAPGAAIGVQLASGDVDATGVGTVTYRLGNRVLAFGHPMFNLGGVSMPMTTAYVHDIFPAYDISFKLASPINVVGELQQDTNFAIGGTVGRVAQTVPMHISLLDAEKKINRDWNMKLIRDPLFTPQMASNIAVEALSSQLGLDSDKTVRVAFRMRLKNGALINRRNTIYAEGQIIQGALSEMLTALSLTQQNPFEKGDIAGLDLSIEVVPERKTATIRAISADRNRVKAGESVTITVEMEPTGQLDQTITKRFVVPVPADAPNGVMRVAVGPADSFWSLRARVGGTPPNPGNLPELLDAYEKVGASDVLQLQASTPDRFLLVDRKKVSDPPPLWGRLVPQTQSSSLRAYNETVEQKQKSEYVLSGEQFLALPVESLRPSDRNEPVGAEQSSDVSSGAFDDGLSGVSAITTFGDEMSSDWTRFDTPARYRLALSKLNLQIPSKGNEPPTLPGAAPTPKSPLVPDNSPTVVAPAATPTPTATPDPAANSIARPPGRWIQNTAADFGSGNFHGAVVRDDGSIVPGPRDKQIASSAEAIAWSLAAAPDNTLYVGTGFNARLLQTRNGATRVMYEGPEVAITALALDSDGTLYAGASPGGRVYRFAPNGKRETLLQTRETFVHALKITPQGLYVATGGPRAALYRVENPSAVAANPIAKPLVVLPQTHLNSLAASGSDIYAGTADDAVLYRVNSAGQATALYQATNPATSGGGSITIQSGGQTQVINVASSPTSVADSALGNPLQRRGGITGGNEITAIVADENGEIYFGTLGASSVYRYTASRGVEEYWKAPMGAIYALTRSGGDLYAGCDGGDVWRLSGNLGDVRAARVLDATQPQVLALASQGQNLFAATANNAAVYQIGASATETKTGDQTGNEYDSDIFDAKNVVRWGAFNTLGSGVAVETRSGNTVDPDATWSNWQPLSDGRIASPASRYLQYRAKFEENGTLSRIEALYRAPNRAPKVVLTLPKGGETVRGDKTLTWTGTDPDGDALRYAVSIAGADGQFAPVEDATPTDAKVELDTTKYADGVYRLQVRASDAARNPGEPLDDAATSLPFTVDNSAPTFGNLNVEKTADGWQINATAQDATSPLAGAEWRIKPDEEKKTDAAKTDATKKDAATATTTATKTTATTTTIATTATAITDETEDSTDETDDETDSVAKAKASANAKAAATARSQWQAVGAADGLFDGKNETLIAILDSAFAPAPLQSGLEIEVRVRDAAGNQTVKTLKLP